MFPIIFAAFKYVVHFLFVEFKRNLPPTDAQIATWKHNMKKQCNLTSAKVHNNSPNEDKDNEVTKMENKVFKIVLQK
jgi:hypothetical protein